LTIGRTELPLARAVLVVDDDPQVLDVTAWMLEDLGCEVITAPSGKDALEKLSTLPHIEILITDVNMPDMDGYQLADAATQMRDRLKVIMLSGQEVDGCGYPFIRKPFLREDLKATMALTTDEPLLTLKDGQRMRWPTTKYRVYMIGRDGRFLGPAKELECADDEEIVAKAMRMGSSLDLEIWDDTRLVARLPGTPAPREWE